MSSSLPSGSGASAPPVSHDCVPAPYPAPRRPTNANFAGRAAQTRHKRGNINANAREDVRMMRSWIHFTRGRFVRQARVGLGELREEHLSRHGFQGPVAMIYRTDGPNEVIRVEGDYRARAVDSADVVASDAADPRGD